MDIENMHPFCLPFSLCHDATSTHGDDIFSKEIGKISNSNGNGGSSSNNNNNNNNINISSNEKDRSIRLEGMTSPIDDPFDCLDRSISSPSSRLLLHGGEDDCSSDPYHALRLDIEMVTDIGDHHQTESKISDNGNADDDHFGLNHHIHDDDDDQESDDWFSSTTHDCLLFSPSDSITKNSRKSLKGAYYSQHLNNNNNHHNHHHQVFHVVDPIDIKSSPTLAQLNLNSNDDPTDSLWDTTTSTSTNTATTTTTKTTTSTSIATPNAQLSNHSNSSNNNALSSDLSTSCTTSLAMNNCPIGSLTTCNHLNHQHQTTTSAANNNNNNHHHHFSHHQNIQNANPHGTSHHTCNHLYNHDSHHHHHHCQKSGGQSTCLAVAPFRKSSLNSPRATTQNNQSHFCTSHNHHQNSQTATSATINNNNNNNIQHNYRNPNNQGLCSHNQKVQQPNIINSSDILNQRQQHEQQQQHQPQLNNNSAVGNDNYQHRTQHQQQQQQQQQQQAQNQQCSSPVPLVTSSSSPLSNSSTSSSSSSAQTTTQTTTQMGSSDSNRLTDNKLKENIEYLTVLLCNGNNKLEKQQSNYQQHHHHHHHHHQQQLQQQPSISSTMVKSSYSTLAQTLATEPKLLVQYNNNHQNNHRQAPPTTLALNTNNQQHGMRSLSTSEASPHHCAVHQQSPISINQSIANNNSSAGLRKISSDQWFRPTNSNTPTVESSISAADSTAENQLSVSENPSAHHISRNSAPTTTTAHGCADYNQHQQHANTNMMCNDLNHHHPASRQGGDGDSEMKVLSSLLNSNPANSMCRTIGGMTQSQTTTTTNTMFAGNTTSQVSANGTTAWQQPTNELQTMSNHNQQVLDQQQHNVVIDQGMMYVAPSNTLQMQSERQVTFNSNQDSSVAASIPPNGRPITLTPLVSNNVIISQRQVPPTQHQNNNNNNNLILTNESNKAAAAPLPPTFAQPASPSSSSTTSSSGNTSEINSSTHVSVNVKRQPAAAKSTSNQQNNKSTSERSGRPNSLSTDCSLSSHDEGFSSQIDQDDCMNSLRGDSDDESEASDSDDESFYGDYSNSDLIGASISDNPDCKWTLTMGRTRRNGQRRFFWQYNVQSKGPKGTRISSTDGSENPFVLPEASDPVFSNDCQIEGVKHSGKARRGDGNDLTPNPKKLLMIGLELKKLSKIINDLAPVTDLPLNARNKTRKEKNKLASRACRLKKKAQHEANKIKLYGLQREHQQVVEAIYDIRKIIRESLAPDETMQKAQQLLKDRNLSTYVKSLIDQCSMNVAGKTSDYVNSVLEKVVSGFIDGGL